VRRMGRGAVTVCFLVCVGAGCSEPSTSSDLVQVRDSAGIRIVETLTVPTDTSAWRVSAEPLFEVGWEEDGPTFQNLEGGVILEGGSMAMGEWNGSRIYYLDGEGGVLRQVGREGEGPGEYRNITALLGIPGDSVLVQDSRNLRITVLAETGEWARGFKSIFSEPRIDHQAIGVTSHQEVLMWPYAYVPSGFSSPGWLEGTLLRVGPDGTAVDTIFTGGFIDHPAPGVRNPFLNFGMAAMGGGMVVYARTDRPEVLWLDEEGALRQVARWEPEWRPVDEGVWSEYEEAYLSRFDEGEERDRIRSNLRDRPRADPEALPLFGRAFVDHEGNAWLGEYRFLGGLPDRYLVVLRDGTIPGWVLVPEGLRILDISESRILGVRTNEWDVQAVVAYGLEKG